MPTHTPHYPDLLFAAAARLRRWEGRLMDLLQRSGYAELRPSLVMREAEGERAAYARGFREGAAAAATLVATHAYAVNNAGPYLKPSEFAEIDVHHKTIAAAIRALPLPEPQA